MEAPYEQVVSSILQKVHRYNRSADSRLLRRAFEFSFDAHRNQLRKSGRPYFEHPLEVSKILTGLRMDYETIAGGVLHDVAEDTGVTIEEVEEKFGSTIATLVDGVTKISELHLRGIETRQAENFRKMLLSMVRDIRVILIKFADRLHNMRTLEYLPERKRERIARETRDVYAPLAHRLGIAKIKWELEDLAFKTLDPQEYDDLVQKVAGKREQREKYIRRVNNPIRETLKQAGITAHFEGRPKHLFSIYNKIKVRGVPFEEIYDLLAIRIIVKKLEECYHALGIVHSLYVPIHERFKDYIATPKSNMYQSLHTTVIGPDGKKVEIQIRTEEMHRIAEDGIASHWRYKEGTFKEDELDKHLHWLKQILDSDEAGRDPAEFMEHLKINLFHDEVFVFTPRGDLHRLPARSTPVDFAFAVHTDIGLHCIAAKVNGRIVALNYELRSGDTVEILTSSNQNPNQDWIKFVRTAKARTRIKKWIRDSQFDESAHLGEELLNSEFKKYAVKRQDVDLQELAQSFGLADVKHFFADVGRGHISLSSVLRKAVPEDSTEKKESSFVKKFVGIARSAAKGVRVQGMDNLMISFGKCCNPVPGDPIIGIVTKGRGIVVHRNDCKNLLRLIQEPGRQVDVEWDVGIDKMFLVGLYVLGQRRKNFLSDIGESIAATDTNIVSANMNAQDSLANCSMILEVKNLNHLTRVMSKVSKVDGVINVARLSQTQEQ